MIECLIFIIMECLFGLFMTMTGIADLYPEIVSALVIGIGTMMIIAIFWKKTSQKSQFMILLSGYGLRILCMLLDVYGRNIMRIPNTNPDSDGFYKVACYYYQNISDQHYTNYPYIINAIFQLFGMNRAVAQYMNVIIWALCVLLLLKFMRKFQLGGKAQIIILFLIALWPNYILATMQLQRESLITFFNFLAFYCLVEWLDGKKTEWLIFSFLAAVPATLLHSASVVIMIVNAIVIAVWDRKEKRIRISGKTIVLMSFIVAGTVALFYSPLKKVFLSYISVQKLDWRTIYDFYTVAFSSGGSDYLRNMQVNNLFEFIVATVIRMIYFMISPVPWEWRGLQDAFAFLSDSIVYIVLLGYIVHRLFKIYDKNKKAYIWFGLLYLIMFTGMFCWGTSNAGTAMRHRSIMTGFVVAILMIALSREEKEKKMEKRIYNRHDRKINGTDIVKSIGKKWIVIISCAILCAGIMTVMVHRKEYNTAVEANLNATATSATAIYNSLTDGEKSSLQLAKTQEEQLLTQKDYISNSVSMKINPYKEGNIILTCSVSSITDADQNMLGEYLESNTFYEDVTDKMVTEVEVQYVKELISFTQNDNAENHTEYIVKIIADSQDLCENIAEAVENSLQNYASHLNESQTDISNSGYSEMVDTDLYDKQYNITNSYYNLQNMYNTTVKSFTENMKIAYTAIVDEVSEDTDNNDSDNEQEIYVPYRIKNAVLGGLIGAILAIFAILLYYLLNDSIKTEEDVESIYGINVLGNMKKKEFVYANMANICAKKGIKRAIVFGTDSSENNSELKDLENYMGKKGIELKIAEDIDKNVESRELLGAYESAFLVLKNKKTKYAEIEEWLKSCDEIEVNVLGALAIE